MAHFGVLHLYTPLLLSHRKFTVDKRLGFASAFINSKLPESSDFGVGVYISAIHLVAMVYILHTYLKFSIMCQQLVTFGYDERTYPRDIMENFSYVSLLFNQCYWIVHGKKYGVH